MQLTLFKNHFFWYVLNLLSFCVIWVFHSCIMKVENGAPDNQFLFPENFPFLPGVSKMKIRYVFQHSRPELQKVHLFSTYFSDYSRFQQIFLLGFPWGFFFFCSCLFPHNKFRLLATKHTWICQYWILLSLVLYLHPALLVLLEIYHLLIFLNKFVLSLRFFPSLFICFSYIIAKLWLTSHCINDYKPLTFINLLTI